MNRDVDEIKMPTGGLHSHLGSMSRDHDLPPIDPSLISWMGKRRASTIVKHFIPRTL